MLLKGFIKFTVLVLLILSISYVFCQETPFVIYGPTHSNGSETILDVSQTDSNRCLYKTRYSYSTTEGDYYTFDGMSYVDLDNVPHPMNSLNEVYDDLEYRIILNNSIAIPHAYTDHSQVHYYLEYFDDADNITYSDTLELPVGLNPNYAPRYISQIDNEHFLLLLSQASGNPDFPYQYKLYYLDSNVHLMWSLDIPIELLGPNDRIYNIKMLDINQFGLLLDNLSVSAPRLVILNRNSNISYFQLTSFPFAILKTHLPGKLLMVHRQNDMIDITKFDNGVMNTILSYPDSLDYYISGTADSTGFLIVQGDYEQRKTYIMKYSWNSELLWTRCYTNTLSLNDCADVSPTGSYYIGLRHGSSYMLLKILSNGESPVDIDEEVLPSINVQSIAYPNPFSGIINIRFSLKSDKPVRAEIYNIKGQRIKSYAEKLLQRGENSITWDGTDERKNLVSNGIYYYRIISENKVTVKKIVLLR